MFEGNLFTTYLRSLHSISNCAAVDDNRITLRRNWRCCVLLHRRSDSEKYRIWSFNVNICRFVPAASVLCTMMNDERRTNGVRDLWHRAFRWFSNSYPVLASIRVFLLLTKLPWSACVTMIVHNFARTLGSCLDHNYKRQCQWQQIKCFNFRDAQRHNQRNHEFISAQSLSYAKMKSDRRRYKRNRF